MPPAAELNTERWQERLDALIEEHHLLGAVMGILRISADGPDQMVDLDTPVHKYLPELTLSVRDATHGVTLRHLLAHVSGIDGDFFPDNDRGDDCLEKFVALGKFADLVVFDPDTVGDKATYEVPHQYATGIKHVLVDGEQALADGKPTGRLAGRALRRSV